MRPILALLAAFLGMFSSAALAETPVVPLELFGELPLVFSPAEVIFDAARGSLWLTDPIGKRLVRVAADEAWTTEEFPFDLSPEAMSVSPDGRRLYVTLVHTPHGPYGGPVPISAPSGALVEVDLVTGGQVRIALPMDPLALAATDRRQVVVSGEQSTQFVLSTVDVESGTIRPPVGGLPFARLQMHPDQRRIYGGGLRFGTGVIARCEVSPEGDLVGDFQVLREGPGGRFDEPLTLNTEGTRLLTRGEFFVLSEDPSSDFRPLNLAPVSFVGRPAFDSERKSLFGFAYVTLNDSLATAIVELSRFAAKRKLERGSRVEPGPADGMGQEYRLGGA